MRCLRHLLLVRIRSYLVTLDGHYGPGIRINTTSNLSIYDLGLSNGRTATVRVEKLTEAREDSGGVVQFAGFHAAALHPAPAPLARRVECIGDSIMCGAHAERGPPFPADCKDEEYGNRESSHLSWCPVLARALEADYQMECCSGNGLVYTDNPLSALECEWGAVPPTCPVMPTKWQQRLCVHLSIYLSIYLSALTPSLPPSLAFSHTFSRALVRR